MKKKLLFLVALLVLVLACVGTALAANTDMIVGEGELIHITTPNGHVLQKDMMTDYTKPTCTEQGLAIFRCTQGGGGVHYHYIGVKALGHDWSNDQKYDDEAYWGRVAEAPSCTEIGWANAICKRCGAVRPAAERYINRVGHQYKYQLYKAVFDEKIGVVDVIDEKNSVFVVAAKYAPTCAKSGLGYLKCTVCGYVEMRKAYTLAPRAHDWTDWTIQTAPTCKAEGKGARACTVCGAHQYLTLKTLGIKWDLDNPKWSNNNPLWVADGVSDFSTRGVQNTDWWTAWLFYKANLKQLNIGWNLPPMAYDDQFTALSAMEALGLKYDIIIDKVKTCYLRNGVVTCAYCRGKWHKNQKAVAFDVMIKEPITDLYTVAKYGIVAHEWIKVPAVPYSSPSSVFYEKNAKGQMVLKKFTVEVAKYGNKPATCTEDGWDLYVCIHDKEALSWFGLDAKYKDEGTAADHEKEPVATRFKRVTTKATGHNWSSWEVTEKYTKKGVQYVLMVRKCKKCSGTEEKVLKAGEVDVDTIKLNKHAITLKITDKDAEPTYTLKATVKPDVADVVWSSSDEEIATVVDGVVVALKKGTVTITVSSKDGEVKDTCTFKIKDKRKNK